MPQGNVPGLGTFLTQSFSDDKWPLIFVPGLGTNLWQSAEIKNLHELGEEALRWTAIRLQKPQDPLLLFWRQQSFAVPVPIIGSFAAKIFRYPQTNSLTYGAGTNLTRYITKTSGHLQPLWLHITGALAILHSLWQHTRPRLHLIRNLLKCLMTKTFSRSRTVGLGTDSPPLWYFLKLYHIIYVFFQLSQADICLPEG